MEEVKSQANSEKQSISDFMDTKSTELVQFKEALSEGLILASNHRLWSSRAFWHKIGFYGWFALFLVSAIGLVFYLVEKLPILVGMLPRDNDGHYPYVSVLFVLLPALAAAWVLRLISRIITTNRILADDAAHREAMIRTYLGLVADKQASMTENDRLVMLTALFRPLPGGQPEEVAPPTILDLVKREH